VRLDDLDVLIVAAELPRRQRRIVDPPSIFWATSTFSATRLSDWSEHRRAILPAGTELQLFGPNGEVTN
jgi:hypothetical protein